jgi:hypothetical protein
VNLFSARSDRTFIGQAILFSPFQGSRSSFVSGLTDNGQA